MLNNVNNVIVCYCKCFSGIEMKEPKRKMMNENYHRHLDLSVSLSQVRFKANVTKDTSTAKVSVCAFYLNHRCHLRFGVECFSPLCVIVCVRAVSASESKRKREQERMCSRKTQKCS